MCQPRHRCRNCLWNISFLKIRCFVHSNQGQTRGRRVACPLLHRPDSSANSPLCFTMDQSMEMCGVLVFLPEMVFMEVCDSDWFPASRTASEVAGGVLPNSTTRCASLHLFTLQDPCCASGIAWKRGMAATHWAAEMMAWWRGETSGEGSKRLVFLLMYVSFLVHGHVSPSVAFVVLSCSFLSQECLPRACRGTVEYVVEGARGRRLPVSPGSA